MFQIFFIPNRILSFTKIVKAEGRKPNLFEFYTKAHPIFYKDTSFSTHLTFHPADSNIISHFNPCRCNLPQIRTKKRATPRAALFTYFRIILLLKNNFLYNRSTVYNSLNDVQAISRSSYFRSIVNFSNLLTSYVVNFD